MNKYNVLDLKHINQKDILSNYVECKTSSFQHLYVKSEMNVFESIKNERMSDDEELENNDNVKLEPNILPENIEFKKRDIKVEPNTDDESANIQFVTMEVVESQLVKLEKIDEYYEEEDTYENNINEGNKNKFLV